MILMSSAPNHSDFPNLKDSPTVEAGLCNALLSEFWRHRKFKMGKGGQNTLITSLFYLPNWFAASTTNILKGKSDNGASGVEFGLCIRSMSTLGVYYILLTRYSRYHTVDRPPSPNHRVNLSNTEHQQLHQQFSIHRICLIDTDEP